MTKIKLIAMCMAVALLMFPICSCNESKSTVDLSDYTFIIASHWDEYDYERGESTYGDIWLDKLDEISKKYGCKFEFKIYSNGDEIANQVHQAILAGDKPFDILDAPIKTYYSLLASKDLYDQKKIPNLDLTSSNFNQNINRIGAWKDGQYGSYFGHTNNIPGLFYNKTMLDQKGLEDPVDLYKSGNWTIQKFEEIMKACLSTTDSGSKVYGMVMGNAMSEYFLTSAGGGLVIQDQNGDYKFGLDSAQSMQVVDTIRGWYRQKLIHPETHYETVKKYFAASRAAFIPHYIWSVESFSNMEEEVGFVPFPSNGTSTENKLYVDECRMFLMPRTLDNPEATGLIYSMLAEVADARKSAMEQSLMDSGCTQDMLEMFKKSENMIEISPARGADTALAEQAFYDVCQDTTREPSSEFATVKSAVQSLVDDFYKSLP